MRIIIADQLKRNVLTRQILEENLEAFPDDPYLLHGLGFGNRRLLMPLSQPVTKCKPQEQHKNQRDLDYQLLVETQLHAPTQNHGNKREKRIGTEILPISSDPRRVISKAAQRPEQDGIVTKKTQIQEQDDSEIQPNDIGSEIFRDKNQKQAV